MTVGEEGDFIVRWGNGEDLVRVVVGLISLIYLAGGENLAHGTRGAFM